MPEELGTESKILYSRQKTKPFRSKEKEKKAKWLSEESLQRAEERSEKQGRKGKVHATNAAFQRIARRDKKVFFNE